MWVEALHSSGWGVDLQEQVWTLSTEERVVVGLSGETVAWLDLADAYRLRGLSLQELTLDKLGHLNDRGHATVAEILAERLDAWLSRNPAAAPPPPR